MAIVPSSRRASWSKRTSPTVLRQELCKPSWRGESVVLGTATDPYQPAEGRFRLARATLEALLRHQNPFSMLTKSPLVLRDLDVLAELARVATVRVYFSITHGRSRSVAHGRTRYGQSVQTSGGDAFACARPGVPPGC